MIPPALLGRLSCRRHQVSRQARRQASDAWRPLEQVPVIEDQKLDARQAFEEPGVMPAACKREHIEQSR
jgi:hypothetical protein